MLKQENLSLQEALWLSLEKQLEKVNKFLNTQIVDLERKLAGATEEIDRVKKLQSFLLEKGLLLDDGTGSLVVSLMVSKNRYQEVGRKGMLERCCQWASGG